MDICYIFALRKGLSWVTLLFPCRLYHVTCSPSAFLFVIYAPPDNLMPLGGSKVGNL